MSIQNNVNAMLGTVAAAATMGKHIKNQNKQLEIEDAADLEQIKSLKTAIANDKDQGLIAIKAYRQKELDEHRANYPNETEDEYKKFVEDFDNKLENEDLEGLREILKQNRDATVRRAGEDYAGALQNEQNVMNDPKATPEEQGLAYQSTNEHNKLLKRAYKRQEEVNERIATSNKLRYEHDAAVARVKARGITKEIR